MLWHLPIFFLDSSYRGTLNLLVLPGFLVGMVAGAIVLTWLYEGSGSNVLLAALWHTIMNLGTATKAGQGALAIAVTAAVIVWALVIPRLEQLPRIDLPTRPAGPESLGREA